jgi:predicted PurR-regulated permease PerM
MNSRVQVSPTLRVFSAIIVTVAVLHYAQDVFVPIALAILLTFLLAPVVERLQRWHVNRGLAVIFSVTVAVLIVGTLVYVVFDQFTDLVQQLPRYRRQLRTNLSEIIGLFRGGVSDTTQAVEQITRELRRVAPAAPAAPNVSRVQVVEAPPANALAALAEFISPLIKPVATTAVVIVFVIFMLLRLPDLRDRIIMLLGSRNLRVTTEALDDAAKRVSRYLIMQTLINAWQGVWVTLGLMMLGVPNAMLWGALTMALRFIPYVGPWVAAAAPVALSIAVFDNWHQPALVVGLFVFLELISNMVLEPWLYGSRTGVSPVALLVAATFWTWLWGAVGLFLAIPLTVCLVVMGKYIPQLWFLEILLGDQPALTPEERLYQRLLASNRDEADDLLEESLRTQGRVQVCDSIVIPAMQLAEEDHDLGKLTDDKRATVFGHVNDWADDFGALKGAGDTNWHGPPPAATGALVLCVPAADQADEIVAKLLTSVLISTAIEARTGLIPEGDEPAPDAVIISALPPDAVTAARKACRRARAQWPGVPILVGLWNASGDLQQSRPRLEGVGATAIVTTFADCLRELNAAVSSAEAPSVARAIPL